MARAQTGLPALKVLPGVAEKELGDHSRPGEGDRLHPLRDELDHDLPVPRRGALALHRLADPRRIPKDEVLFSPRRAVIVDESARLLLSAVSACSPGLAIVAEQAMKIGA